MTSRALSRPYPPDLCSRTTLAYRLDVSVHTVSEWVRLGMLPQPIRVATQDRWEWAAVTAWIAAQNGRPVTAADAGVASDPPPTLTSDVDPYAEAINGATPHA